MYDNEYILEHYDVYEYLLYIIAKSQKDKDKKESTKS